MIIPGDGGREVPAEESLIESKGVGHSVSSKHHIDSAAQELRVLNGQKRSGNLNIVS